MLFLIIFLWTPPHFWALALYKQCDYGAAGIPMLPNVAGEAATKLQILLYSVVLVASTLVAGLHRLGGLALYAPSPSSPASGFLYLAWRLFRTRRRQAMRKAGRALFTYSLSYLFVIFLALLDRSSSWRSSGMCCDEPCRRAPKLTDRSELASAAAAATRSRSASCSARSS